MAKKRPIKTYYFGKDGLIARVGRAASLKGAVKGASMKVYTRKFAGAQIELHGRVIVNIYREGRAVTIRHQK
jgi:hypothetical protein